jgi:cellulose synthase/poly-beta-1,6-N-acetylglucosamine synthase-like glycosyltransferase
MKVYWMQLAREPLDPCVIFIASFGLLSTQLTAFTVPAVHGIRRAGKGVLWPLALALGAASALAYVTTRSAPGTAVAAVITAATCLLIKAALPRLTMIGAMETARPLVSTICLFPWAYLFLAQLGYPDWALQLMVVGMAASLPLFGLKFAIQQAQDAVLTHGTWRRPTGPLPAGERIAHQPKVSIHLPCYAEPPAVVMATLDRLAALDYPDLEVIVCDNNTKDPQLWLPLEAHCERLNRQLGASRFRFFHVEQLPGAKAGALNFCLRRTAADAQLIGVVDADYLARSDFLSRLVGFFADPAVGFVQTSHDYRDAEASAFRTMCYWEYLPHYKVGLVSLQEYDAAFTIGTMCLLRREALAAAGGWAEWCLTEDSEVSVRVRAAGYTGMYLRDTFGQGLIPETFDDYKQQRFRWTAGPVQQLRRHWRLYLPRRFAQPSHLTGWAKLLELQHSLSELGSLELPLALLLGLAFGSLIVTGVLPTIYLPAVVWMAMPLGMAGGLIRRWHLYRLAGCRRISEMVGGTLAHLSLNYVKMIAALAGLLPRPIRWRRTPKFATAGSGARAFVATTPEAAMALGHLALVALPVTYWQKLGPHLAPLATVGIVLSAIPFLCAPLMAYLSERALVRRAPRHLVSGRHAAAGA